ncbi:hypothetical protein DRN34_00240 [Thermococci archaeon]|nr:MAG: hypothetical protein DRN34_00240 [Thermococci archaeon]
MGEPNQVRWVGIRPVEPEEDIPVKTDYSKASVKVYASDGSSVIPVSDRRLKHFAASASEVTLDPNTKYTVLNANGAGILVGIGHRSWNVAAGNAFFMCELDGYTFNSYIVKTDIAYANAYGINSVGIHELGASVMAVTEWDETNNRYYLFQYNDKIPFAESIYFYLWNRDSSNQATMWGYVHYHLYTSSRVISLKTKHSVSKYVSEIKRMIDKDYKKCDAVIWQIESNIDEFEQVKEKNIAKLHIVVDDDVFEKLKNKIINRLIKERMVCL